MNRRFENADLSTHHKRVSLNESTSGEKAVFSKNNDGFITHLSCIESSLALKVNYLFGICQNHESTEIYYSDEIYLPHTNLYVMYFHLIFDDIANNGTVIEKHFSR